MLRILYWNIRSIRAHGPELSHYLSDLSQESIPDILCIQETWLKNGARFTMHGYCAEHRYREMGERGGVSTFIRAGLSYSVLPPPSDLECIIISITLLNGKNLNIMNVYDPPSNAWPVNRVDEYKQLFSHRNAFIVGDFNAYHPLWGSKTTDSRGRALVDLLQDFNFTCINTGEGTHLTDSGDLNPLDLTFVSSHLALESDWEVHPDFMGSDHGPCFVTFRGQPLVENSTPHRWIYTRADWTSFRASCSAEINGDLINYNNINESYNTLTDKILELGMKHIPNKKPVHNKSIKIKQYMFWNEECTTAVRNRNKAKNRMLGSKDLDDCIEYRRLKGIAQHAIKQAKAQSWSSYCSTLNDRTKMASVWRTAKAMTGPPKAYNIPSLTEGTIIHSDNASKADLLSRVYAGVSSSSNYSTSFQRHKTAFETMHHSYLYNDVDVDCDISNDSDDHDNIVEINNDRNDPDINSPFSIFELLSAIESCKKKSAPGKDNISYQLIKNLPRCTIYILLKIYNAIWKDGHLPGAWKHSIVVPILKPGKNKNLPDSYRPISLTSSLCKLMERMVTNRLTSYLESRNLLSVNQAGFRQGRRCLDQILLLQDEITKAMSRKGHTMAVFIDFERAFDLMWVDGLLFKLRSMGITGRTYRFVRDFLSDRTIQVRVGSILSKCVQMENGCPQGSVLSPMLFLIMMNDYPVDPRNGCKLSLFADDSTIYKSGNYINYTVGHLQKYLNNIYKWCERWGLKISTSKTVCVIFTTKRLLDPPPLTLNGRVIKYEKTAKFLGMVFDGRMTWTPHINYIVDKCQKRINFMRSITGSTWGGGKRELLIVYKALVLSLIDYGCQAYLGAAATALEKLNVLQSKALSICCGACKSTSVSALQVECGVMPLRLRRESLSLRYACVIMAQNNNPTKNILQPTFHQKFSKNKHGNHIFYYQVIPTIQSFNIPPLQTHIASITWNLAPCDVDLSLSDIISKKTNSPDTMRKIALDYVYSKYSNFIHIFTDGSKLQSGQVSSAIYAPLRFEHAVRLPDGASILTAELHALRMALLNVPTETPSGKQIAILSDSLGALQTLMRRGHRFNDPLIIDIKNKIHLLISAGILIVLIWIPAHTGIPGNEHVDALAKQALSHTHVEINMDPNQSDYNKAIDEYIINQWQLQWDGDVAGRHYHTIQPSVSRRSKYAHPGGRGRETLISRMRLGKCLLNTTKHLLGIHETGQCDSCGVQESIEHYLMHCTGSTDLHSALGDACTTNNLIFSLQSILNSTACHALIYHHVLTSKRKL